MQVADLLVGGAGAGHTETAHCLLVAGADPDCVVTCSGNTALHAAAEVSVNTRLISKQSPVYSRLSPV